VSEPHRVNVEQALSAARAGSREALGRALQAYRPYLLEIAREEIDTALQAKGGASDLVQETFLEASRTFPRFEGSSGPELRAWLRCLLRHHVAKHGRRFRETRKRWVGREQALRIDRDGHNTEEALGADVQTPSAAVAADEELGLLHQALDRLPPDYRRVVHLRYREGRSFEEIGLRMGRTANAARLLWLRAVERVKQELGPGPHG
jgi:RNA polymerase sigma-70 factor (ECF subfamily)